MTGMDLAVMWIGAISAMVSVFSPEILDIISKITLLALSDRFDELVDLGYITEPYISFISDTINLVDNKRYIIPNRISIEILDVVPFTDGRGYSVELEVPVTKGADDLSQIILGFEILNNGDVKITNAYW